MKTYLAILTLLTLAACVATAPMPAQPEHPQTAGAFATYDNGTVTYSIPVTKPTPCYNVTSDMLVLESYPVQLRLTINIEQPDSGTFCAQVLEETAVNGTYAIDHKPGNFMASVNGEQVYSTTFQ